MSVTNHVYMGFVVFYRSERKEPTVEMEPNAGPPHNDRQRYNDLVFIPNRNASGINEHLIPGSCHYMESWLNTYVRRTINSVAAIDARHKNS
jgi:hypothetical protein